MCNNDSHLEKIKMCIDLFDINEKNSFDIVALQYAMQKQNPKLVEFLLERGADLNKVINNEDEMYFWVHEDYLKMVKPRIYLVDDIKCVSCLSDNILEKYYNLGCGHMFCKSCNLKLDNCSYCEKPITEYVVLKS